MLTVVDLFSGIGGFSLGLERTGGFRTIAFCEIDPFCQAVIRKHWPDVPLYPDVRAFPRIAADVVCGGFPCQDISLAGKGAGLGGERSGLWREMHRVIAEIRPRWVVVENVSALRSRGLDAVLGSLAEIGYDAEWHCIPASAVGAPHRRDRVWIIAYPNGQGQHARAIDAEVGSASEPVAHADGDTRDQGRPSDAAQEQGRRNADRSRLESDVADAEHGGCQGRDANGQRPETALSSGEGLLNANGQPQGRLAIARGECSQWLVEPDVGRVANGIPARVDRLRALGNAVVPQIVEAIGRAILRAEG